MTSEKTTTRFGERGQEPFGDIPTEQADSFWPLDAEMIEGREGTIPLAGLGIGLSMAAVFRGIPDAPTADKSGLSST